MTFDPACSLRFTSEGAGLERLVAAVPLLAGQEHRPALRTAAQLPECGDLFAHELPEVEVTIAGSLHS
jgi:hypothetical protein